MIGGAAGQSFADGEWRRKANGVTIIGPAALLDAPPGESGVPRWSPAKKAQGSGKGHGKSLSFGSGHGGSAAKGPSRGGESQGKGGGKGHYKGKGDGLGGGSGYKPARSEPWVRCHCPRCPGFAKRISFKFIHQIVDGAKCQGCGTDWDFSLAAAVQLGEVPGYRALDESEGRLVGPLAPAATAGSPFQKVAKVEASLDRKEGTFATDKAKSAFGNAAIPKEALEACPEALRSYLGRLLFGEAKDPDTQRLLLLFETKAESGDEAARALLHALALARTAGKDAAIKPAKAKRVQKDVAWSHERQQAYTSKQAAQLEVSKLEKSVEVTCREIWKAKAEKDRLKTAMEEAELTLQKAQQTHKEELAKLRSARATSQLEEQRLDAIRVREESEGTSVPADDDDDKAPKQGSGLTLAQEQGIMREVQKKFGIHAPQLQEILGPLAQIFVAALRPSFMEGLSSIPAETKAPTSALDSEAMAEAEEIKEENANAINETLGHEAQIGEKEAWDLAAKKCKEELQHERNLSFLEVKDASAMDAETERAAQIKRPMEVEIDTIGDEFEDVFSLQEQQDIQAALELSRADQKDQDAAVPGAKS